MHNAIIQAASSVTLRSGREGDFEELTVSDDGAGFSPVALELAFERFCRDDEARGRGGTGLGMPIARALVLGAGGTVDIANEPGDGAAVRTRLLRVDLARGPN